MRPGDAIGAENRLRVLAWLLENPGGTNVECSAEIGLSVMAVGRHVKQIRARRLREKSERKSMSDERELSFGEKAVGLAFNPSGDDAVANCKVGLAAAINQMNDFRNEPTTSPEAKRLASIAITELQGAQMWAVKALTWRD